MNRSNFNQVKVKKTNFKFNDRTKNIIRKQFNKFVEEFKSKDYE